MAQVEYDYVVVGAGSAGCIVAAELASVAGNRVLLLEAGGRAEDSPETLRAGGYKQAFINDRVIWERMSEPQPGCGGRRLFLGSGRVVGGSGGVNAMVYTRGSASDYAMWGVDGWGWDDVAPVFDEIERRIRPRRMAPTEFTEACVASAEQAGFTRKEDLNDGALRGFLGYEWMNVEGDERRHSYAAFLRPLLPSEGLAVITSALVRRVLFEGRRAAAVEYEVGGRRLVARAKHEVVLCAGALETPKLLQLSGVGAAERLRALGIDVVADLPAVGEGLQDHPNVVVFSTGERTVDCLVPQLYGFHRAAPASSLPPEQADTCYVFYPARSSFREGVIRVLPTMILPAPLYRLGWVRRGLRALIAAAFLLPPIRRLVDRMYGIVVILGKPASRGRVTIVADDPHRPARVDPGYFTVRADLDALVAGVALARRVADSTPLVAWGNRERIPGRRVQGSALERWVQRNAITTYHFAGTCRMGDDDAAVVDGRLRVRGVEGLRVADASVIPVVPVSALNAPSMLIGLRAARFVLEERERRERAA